MSDQVNSNFDEVEIRGLKILQDAAAGRFKVVGYQNQMKSAEEISALPLVQFFSWNAQTPKELGSLQGPLYDEMTYVVWITVAASATADLHVLRDLNATDEDRALALLRGSPSGMRSNKLLNKIIAAVRNIIMDARNREFDMPKGIVSNRWVSGWTKNDALLDGQFLTLTASMQINCRIKEDITGEIPIAPTGVVVNSTLDIDGDDVEQTGVQVDVPA